MYISFTVITNSTTKISHHNRPHPSVKIVTVMIGVKIRWGKLPFVTGYFTALKIDREFGCEIYRVQK